MIVQWEMRAKGHKYFTWMSVSNILHSPDKDNLWRAVEEFELQKCMEQKKHEKDKNYKDKDNKGEWKCPYRIVHIICLRRFSLVRMSFRCIDGF